MLLQPDNTIAIVAPAGALKENALAPAIETLKSWGIKAILGKNVYKTSGYFAGNNQQRTEDLQWALNHPEVKAIICARGGYGSTRIIDHLDFSGFAKSPKWLVGFSDITALHAKINNLEIPSILGPMGIHFGKEEYAPSIEKLKEQLFRGAVEINTAPHPINITGAASGVLVGGNLTLLTHLLGTPEAPDTYNKVLLLEDIGEDIYKIDRMMVQLKRAGKLNHISALLVGHFTDIKDTNPPYEMDVYEVIRSHISNEKVPVGFNFPSGHEAPNYPVVLGALCQLNIDASGLSFRQKL